ncbi:MAG: hypothetical protein BWZ10_01583 [candidate division BRC1 bacterium ADurb.BinA364]|nr:MAG: hypothetical protein BWZ10_01583 [candidate division BRC1 bacterium ADurb.BinA364]
MVYSVEAKPVDLIAEYARRFSTAEIDSAFFGILRPAAIEGWRVRMPE